MKLLVLDTETTGVNDTDKVVELAWIEVDEDLQVLDRVQSLIDPEMQIPPGASGVHGITDRHVVNAPTLPEFFEFIAPQTDEPILMIAHNAAFDVKFVKGHMPVTDVLCTMRLAKHLYPNSPDFRLQTLRYVFGVESDAIAHGAAGDCDVCLLVLRAMLEDSKLSLTEATELAKRPIRYTTMQFGKHKGEALADVPSGYKRWLFNQPDVDPDLIWSFNNL